MKLAKVFEAFYRDSHDINGMINSPSHTSEIEPNQSPSTMDYSEPRNFRPQIMHNLSSDDTDAINNAISKEQAQRDKNPPIEASDYPVTILRPQQRRTITDTSISSLDASEIPSFNQPSPYVLLVDDNGVNLQLLVAFMNKLSLRYARANNGLEAFEAYKERALAGNPFDYVLMDINMPVMDGLTSTKQIRNFERQNSSKKSIIAALTGMAGQSIQEEAFQIGFDHYFSKPVRFKELKRVILGD